MLETYLESPTASGALCDTAIVALRRTRFKKPDYTFVRMRADVVSWRTVKSHGRVGRGTGRRALVAAHWSCR